MIAALLHDAVEDHGGTARLEDIRRNFGAKVARMVEGVRGGGSGFLRNYLLLHDANADNLRLRAENDRRGVKIRSVR